MDAPSVVKLGVMPGEQPPTSGSCGELAKVAMTPCRNETADVDAKVVSACEHYPLVAGWMPCASTSD